MSRRHSSLLAAVSSIVISVFVFVGPAQTDLGFIDLTHPIPTFEPMAVDVIHWKI